MFISEFYISMMLGENLVADLTRQIAKINRLGNKSAYASKLRSLEAQLKAARAAESAARSKGMQPANVVKIKKAA